METGRVKWYNIINGSGYISPDNGGEDLVAKRHNLADDIRFLKENQKVFFEVEKVGRENVAVNIKVSSN